MSNNYYDDDEELSRPKKKNSPLFMFTFIGLFILALATGAYYVFLSPDFINEPVVQRRTTPTSNLPSDSASSLHAQNSPSSTSLNTQSNDTQELQNDNNNILQAPTTQTALLVNEEMSNEQLSVAESQNTAPAFPFEDYSAENLSHEEVPPLSSQVAKTSNDENTLAVHNMDSVSSASSGQSKNQNQASNQNTAQIRAQTSELNVTNNTFELAPPRNTNSNFHIASEEELAQKRQATEQSRLEQLQRAKAEQIELTEAQKATLPSSQMVAMSDTLVTQLPNNDPTITQLFLHSMAQILVNNYNATQNNVATNTISASKLSQYFGTTLRGLAHPKGRSGIFEYAYQPQMITKISDYMTPRLLAEMNIVAKQKDLSSEEEVKMYHTYGNHVADTANILNAVTKTSNIKNLISQTLDKEKLLLAKKQDFAEQQIAFENAKLERKNTEQIEQNMQNIAKEAAIFEQEYLTSKRLVVGAVFKEYPEIQRVSMGAQARQEEIYELALWAYRRNNTSANNAAIAALSKFANALKSQ